jgi:hypothetical protein
MVPGEVSIGSVMTMLRQLSRLVSSESCLNRSSAEIFLETKTPANTHPTPTHIKIGMQSFSKAVT